MDVMTAKPSELIVDVLQHVERSGIRDCLTFQALVGKIEIHQKLIGLVHPNEFASDTAGLEFRERRG